VVCFLHIIFILKHYDVLCASLEPDLHQVADLMQIACTNLSFSANVCEHLEFLDSAVLRVETTPAALGSTFAAQSDCMEQRNVF